MEQSVQYCVAEECTIREVLKRSELYLQAKGIGEARENAELILRHVLHLERAQLMMQWNEQFPEHARLSYVELLERKAAGEPVQYILGFHYFYGRRFDVTEAVLIPRPETELLVEAVLQEASQLWSVDETPVLLDIGTGSGAIALSLQAERPNWKIIASDISEEALKVAKHNAARLELQQVTFSQGDLLEPYIADAKQLQYQGQAIDILVSNPPYIPNADKAGLQVEVREYEPHLALFGGEDGLNPYRAMLQQLAALEIKPRIVAFELGIYQPAIVAQMMEELKAWNSIKIIKDYNGIDRHIIAVR